jgi:hypothetical protein
MHDRSDEAGLSREFEINPRPFFRPNGNSWVRCVAKTFLRAPFLLAPLFAIEKDAIGDRLANRPAAIISISLVLLLSRIG